MSRDSPVLILFSTCAPFYFCWPPFLGVLSPFSFFFFFLLFPFFLHTLPLLNNYPYFFSLEAVLSRVFWPVCDPLSIFVSSYIAGQVIPVSYVCQGFVFSFHGMPCIFWGFIEDRGLLQRLVFSVLAAFFFRFLAFFTSPDTLLNTIVVLICA